MLTVIIATDVLTAGEAATGYLNAAIGIGGRDRCGRGRRSSPSGAASAAPMLLGAAVMAVGAAGPRPGDRARRRDGRDRPRLGAATSSSRSSGATLLQRVTTDAVRGRAVGADDDRRDAAPRPPDRSSFPSSSRGSVRAAVLGVSGVLMLVAIVVGVALIGPSITRRLNVHEATLGRVLELPLFAGVSNAAVERALERLVEVPMAAGDVVIRQGEPADRFYVIESGTVVVTQTDAVRRATRAPADGTGRSLRGARPAVRGAAQRHGHGSDRRPAPRARRRAPSSTSSGAGRPCAGAS